VTDQINHLIAQSGKVAFEAGRRAERDLYKAAIKFMKCENHIGEYVYLSDLEDYLADLRKEEK
jgi:hypothetical protein